MASRDIAQRLHLSPRTVDNHLQRVFTKLGINGRAGLSASLTLLGEEP
jgi:DNA-binding CsgD family transcriptional regulator